MKNISTTAPVIPVGYTGKNYNKWINYIYRQIAKIH